MTSSMGVESVTESYGDQIPPDRYSPPPLPGILPIDTLQGPTGSSIRFKEPVGSLTGIKRGGPLEVQGLVQRHPRPEVLRGSFSRRRDTAERGCGRRRRPTDRPLGRDHSGPTRDDQGVQKGLSRRKRNLKRGEWVPKS